MSLRLIGASSLGVAMADGGLRSIGASACIEVAAAAAAVARRRLVAARGGVNAGNAMAPWPPWQAMAAACPLTAGGQSLRLCYLLHRRRLEIAATKRRHCATNVSPGPVPCPPFFSLFAHQPGGRVPTPRSSTLSAEGSVENWPRRRTHAQPSSGAGLGWNTRTCGGTRSSGRGTDRTSRAPEPGPSTSSSLHRHTS